MALFFSRNRFLASRSRKGAWIEINVPGSVGESAVSRSRKGAWIEIAISANAWRATESLP